MRRTTKLAAKKPRKAKSTPSRAKRKARTTTRAKKSTGSVKAQVKTTALKVLAGAASGAVQALIPPLEDAAARTAQSAGTAASGEREASGARKRK